MNKMYRQEESYWFLKTLFLYCIWIGFGFIHGLQWIAVGCFNPQRRNESIYKFCFHFICIIGLAVGGGYCRAENTYQLCPNGETMSLNCLYNNQSSLYQFFYIEHFILGSLALILWCYGFWTLVFWKDENIWKTSFSARKWWIVVAPVGIIFNAYWLTYSWNTDDFTWFSVSVFCIWALGPLIGLMVLKIIDICMKD